MADQRTIDRIRKILALAEGTDNPVEAETMMQRVQALLDEHNLKLLDIEQASDEDPIGTERAAFHHFVKDSWYKWTIVRLSQLYGARVVWYKVSKNKTVFDVSGRESARITLTLMLPFVKRQITTRARELRARTGDSQAKCERYIANALNDRIARMVYMARRKEDTRVATGGRALIPVDEIQAEVDRAHGELRNVGQKEVKTTDEAMAEAENISLNRQTGATINKKLENKK